MNDPNLGENFVLDEQARQATLSDETLENIETLSLIHI